MKHVLVCIILLTGAVVMRAQEDPEYKMEIGGGVGLVNYFGDFNESLFGNMQPMGSIVAKYRPNPRMSWAVTIGYGNLKGSVRDEKTWYPETETMPADFSHSLIDGGLRFEYNFWPYGTGREYRCQALGTIHHIGTWHYLRQDTR